MAALGLYENAIHGGWAGPPLWLKLPDSAVFGALVRFGTSSARAEGERGAFEEQDDSRRLP
ncbi:MAG: hypothetical protein HY900_03975 [Deltaproteobacteria bacterium]|nr:hypothetical protein [Deltaproteobacteria bacterium]